MCDVWWEVSVLCQGQQWGGKAALGEAWTHNQTEPGATGPCHPGERSSMGHFSGQAAQWLGPRGAFQPAQWAVGEDKCCTVWNVIFALSKNQVSEMLRLWGSLVLKNGFTVNRNCQILWRGAPILWRTWNLFWAQSQTLEICLSQWRWESTIFKRDTGLWACTTWRWVNLSLLDGSATVHFSLGLHQYVLWKVIKCFVVLLLIHFVPVKPLKLKLPFKKSLTVTTQREWAAVVCSCSPQSYNNLILSFLAPRTGTLAKAVWITTLRERWSGNLFLPPPTTDITPLPHSTASVNALHRH